MINDIVHVCEPYAEEQNGRFLPFSNHWIFFSDSWDCVVTCYFIDTAHSVIAYIENISKILKPGGYWINLGKLTKMLDLSIITR